MLGLLACILAFCFMSCCVFKEQCLGVLCNGVDRLDWSVVASWVAANKAHRSSSAFANKIGLLAACDILL